MIAKPGFVAKPNLGPAASAAPGIGADQPCRTRSDRGSPSDPIRFRTPHFTAASTCCRPSPLALSLIPTRALNRDTAFSAKLWRVAPLELRHWYRPWTLIASRTESLYTRYGGGSLAELGRALRRGGIVGVAPRARIAS